MIKRAKDIEMSRRGRAKERQSKRRCARKERITQTNTQLRNTGSGRRSEVTEITRLHYAIQSGGLTASLAVLGIHWVNSVSYRIKLARHKGCRSMIALVFTTDRKAEGMIG